MIFVLISSLSFAPIASAKYSNNRSTIGKSHCENASINFAEAVIPVLGLAVGNVLGNHTLRVSKSVLRSPKRNTMFALVFSIFFWVPIEAHACHLQSLLLSNIKSHTFVQHKVNGIGENGV